MDSRLLLDRCRRRSSRAALGTELPVQVSQRSPYRDLRRVWGWDGAHLDTDAAVFPLMGFPLRQRPTRSTRLSFGAARIETRW